MRPFLLYRSLPILAEEPSLNKAAIPAEIPRTRGIPSWITRIKVRKKGTLAYVMPPVSSRRIDVCRQPPPSWVCIPPIWRPGTRILPGKEVCVT
ncbi:hypothetical protein CaCOL14_000643 [Colletotrichum acutatum]